jgi:hypothetical protein
MAGAGGAGGGGGCWATNAVIKGTQAGTGTGTEQTGSAAGAA